MPSISSCSTKGIIFCSIECFWSATNFEGLLNHLHGNFSLTILDPTKKHVTGWGFLLSCRPVLVLHSNGLLISQVKYFHLSFSLNDLFRQRSSGWRTGVSPPGVTPTSMFDDEGDSSLVRWGGLRRNPIPGGTFHWEDYAANNGRSTLKHLPRPSILSSGTKPS